MSTALAIASVTHVLMDLLNNGLIDQDITSAIGTNVTVTALPPDRIDTTPANEQSQLNLFMYQTTPNLGWRNVGLPSRDVQGERVINPPLAIDLHYLLTAYGAHGLHTDILLGYGMQLLHETPVLVRDAIRRSLTVTSVSGGGLLPLALRALATSELAEQVEQIKITPESLNTEEISKLWTAFQAKFRPTAAYKASVILIQSRRSTKSALPVRGRKLYVEPFNQPVIEKIKSQATSSAPIIEDQQILPGYNLIIEGRNLRSDTVHINMSGIEVTPAVEDVSDTQIIIPLPASLSAGVHGVQVVHRILMGSPPVPHRGVESNVAAFVLHPQIIGTIIANSSEVALTVNPAVGETQRVVLLLNEYNPIPLNPPADVPPLSYSFHAPPMALLSPPAPTENIAIPISGVSAGVYLVRVQVDGAESPLRYDPAGQYDRPQVTIP
ncbi:MAG: DUF4255 domain-containing protein [Candidatus Scalindua sp. AMX11]|nr:DUF4255 domain-containing protein [Planctomycetota bacterium]RZV62010.1 MAG: DUF4255 domain-containing protein [Candidatus Scalindua sp. SCAELEC01]TDE63304.1 MAG: DUF4255 domain-containing protein [Candidatus Scalindua sp. AMX11]GJQ57401.1 MAG: hypothetical protein SCALA701_02020 [Candidatus Scalindua sp.]